MSDEAQKTQAEEATNKPASNENKPKSKSAGFFERFKTSKDAKKDEEIEFSAWLDLASEDSSAYLKSNERLSKAIGEPTKVDTKKTTPQERAVYGGDTIERYDSFSHLYDLEKSISKVVNYLNNGAPGILVLSGPVGSGKTEIATTLEKLMEKEAIYILKSKKTGELSPFNDTPLCLLTGDMEDYATEELGIEKRYFKGLVKSKWVTDCLEAADGDVTEAFSVVKTYPSRDKQLGVFKLDPDDKKNANMASLVGTTDISKVGDEDPLDENKTMSAGNPNAYKTGAFSKANQGFFHFAEGLRNNDGLMTKFLETVTTGFFTGADGIGMLPMDEVIALTTNLPVLEEFMNKHDSDAANDRVTIINVPYTLRMSEEMKIYKKLLNESPNANKPIAPGTIDLLAEFSVATRIHMEGRDKKLAAYDDPFVRTKVLNGEVPDGAKVPKIHELQAHAHPTEGMSGFSTRDAEKVLMSTFMARASKGIQEADTILLLETLKNYVKEAPTTKMSEDTKAKYNGLIGKLASRQQKVLDEKINNAIIDADDATCQRMFDEYIAYAEAWKFETDLVSEVGEPINHAKIEAYLKSFEKRAGITHGEQFRKDTLSSYNSELARIGRNNNGKPLEEQQEVKMHWDSYKPVAEAIRKQHELDNESRRHILKAKSVENLRSEDEKRQFNRFHENMEAQGYTETMVSRMLDHLGPS